MSFENTAYHIFLLKVNALKALSTSAVKKFNFVYQYFPKLLDYGLFVMQFLLPKYGMYVFQHKR